ncbi:MAG: hypothetical protein V1690_03440 [Candidatus Moraniibacteriota bacterium]
MKKRIIYVFGNPLLDFDSLPIKLVPKLRKKFPRINFVIADPNENLKPEKGKLYIIDTMKVVSGQWSVVSENKIQVIEDLDKILLDKIYSAHDFDLGFNLKLLQKIGELKWVVIFGVPNEMNEEDALIQLVESIKKCHSEPRRRRVSKNLPCF